MQQENLLFEIKYDIVGRIWSIIFWTISMSMGGMLIFLGMIEKFLLIMGLFVFTFSFVRLIDVICFEKMEFFEKRIVKIWRIFGVYELEISSLKTSKGNGVFGGMILFWKDGYRIKHVLFFGLDLLPITNNQISEIKKGLIRLNVIKGNEHDWID